jgi:hypothetical protein
MVDEPLKRAGPPKKVGEPKPFQLTVPKPLYDYLTYLATHSTLGISEGEVAAHILIRELTTMLKEGFHNLRVPRD